MSSAGERARAWRHEKLAAVCDSIEPWEFGRVARASRYPDYYEYNVVLVERQTGLEAGELAAAADELLTGLAHRRVDVEDVEEATRLRNGFESLGWERVAIVWMLFEGEQPPPPLAAPVAEVAYDDVVELWRQWHREDFPDAPEDDYHAHAREVALLRGDRVFAVSEGGRPIAFAQLEPGPAGVEVGAVFVTRERRGSGLGTALTSAAVAAALGHGDVWISADADDRPQHLYARLGFRPVWRMVQFTRLPWRA